MATRSEPAAPAAPLRLHYRVVDPVVEALTQRLDRLSSLRFAQTRRAQALRTSLRLGLAGLLGFAAAFLLATLVDAFARWPGQ